jgi:hypothetical protein
MNVKLIGEVIRMKRLYALGLLSEKCPVKAEEISDGLYKVLSLLRDTLADINHQIRSCS